MKQILLRIKNFTFILGIAGAIGLITPAHSALATFPGDVNKAIVFTGLSQPANGLGDPSSDGGNIVTILPNGNDRTPITNLTGFPQPALNPMWSPSGESITYVCFDEDIFSYRLCVMNADGTNNYEISGALPSAGPVNDSYYPTWSPDGTKVALLVGNQVTIYNADGSGSTNVDISGVAGAGFTASAAWYHSRVSWSADNTLAVGVQLTGVVSGSIEGWGVYTLKLDGSQVTEIVQDIGGANQVPPLAVSWSPDSSKLLVGADPQGSAHWNNLAIYGRTGTLEQTYQMNVTLSGGIVDAVWSPDGKKIAFTLFGGNDPYDDGYYENGVSEFILYVMDVATGPSAAQAIAATANGASGVGRTIDWRGAFIPTTTPPSDTGTDPEVAAPNAPDAGVRPVGLQVDSTPVVIFTLILLLATAVYRLQLRK